MHRGRIVPYLEQSRCFPQEFSPIVTNTLYREFQKAHTEPVPEPNPLDGSKLYPSRKRNPKPPDMQFLRAPNHTGETFHPALTVPNPPLTPYFIRIYPQPLSIEEFAITGPYPILPTLFDPRIYEEG